MSDSMREEFEEWASTHEIRCAWDVWKASRESIVVELPKAWQTNIGAMLTPNGVKFAIETAGLKYTVKP